MLMRWCNWCLQRKPWQMWIALIFLKSDSTVLLKSLHSVTPFWLISTSPRNFSLRNNPPQRRLVTCIAIFTVAIFVIVKVWHMNDEITYGMQHCITHHLENIWLHAKWKKIQFAQLYWEPLNCVLQKGEFCESSQFFQKDTILCFCFCISQDQQETGG